MSEGERLVSVSASLSAYPSLCVSSLESWIMVDCGSYSQFPLISTKLKFDSHKRVNFVL